MTALLLAATEPSSAPVTDWPERLAWTAVTLAVVVGLALLMLRGWRRRAERQSDVPPLPDAPADVDAQLLADPVEGVYVSTTTAGDWLDRIAVHGLGVRSAAVLNVSTSGITIARQGAPHVHIPAAQLKDVRLDKGMAGKFVEEEGLVVLTWQLGERTLDTGIRTRRGDDRDAVVSAVRSLLAGAA